MNSLIVARLTLQEAIGRRLVLAALIISLLYVGLFALGFNFAYDKALENSRSVEARLAVGAAIGTLTLLGLYVVYVLAGFLSLFLAVGSISSDIESGTLHAVLARPLRRSEYILGRWLAYVALITVYVVAMVGLILLVARIIAGFEVPEPVPATGFLLLSAILLLTLSLFGSTIFPTLANGVIVFSLLGLAWLGGIIEAVARVLNNATMLNLATLVSLLLPSDGLWRAASYYLQPPSILAISAAARGANPFVGYLPPTTPYIIWAGLYPLVFLLLAVFTFSRRDL